jgi:glycosyltransferase involved in cell wall biosynthesis
MNRKRILFVEQNLDGTIGGSHHSLLLLVRYLDRTLFEPTVAFYQRNALIPEFERYAKVVVLPAPEPIQIKRGANARASDPIGLAALGAQKVINATRAAAAAMARVFHVVTFIRPDLIHLNNCVLVGRDWLLAARATGARCIVHQRGFATPTGSVRGFDKVICISRDVHESLARQVPDLAARAIQIYNGIDVAEYTREAHAKDSATIRHEFNVAPDDVLIGLVGNLQRWKGQDVLLDALPKLQSTAGWRALLIGAAPVDADGQAYYRRLQDQLQRLGLQDRVTFTGYRSDVSSIVNALDVLVHTSVTPEPMGRVILEGMALGKPVIATDHGGPREIIEQGRSGFLVTPGDPQALAALLDRVIASSELRETVGREAIARVSEHFSVAEYARRVQEVYLTFWPELRPPPSVSRAVPNPDPR